MFTYLIKVNCLLVIFTAVYWVFLRRGRLLQLNRLILGGSILFAFLLPVLPLSGLIHRSLPKPVLEITQLPTTSLSELIPAPSEPAQLEPPGIDKIDKPIPLEKPSLLFIIWCLYLVGVGTLAYLLLRQAFHVFNLILYSTNTRQQDLTMVHTDEDIPPFSFFRFLVINPTKYNDAEMHNILLHEQVHIQQRHYLDILLGELMRLVCWFNPAAWALNRLLKINLEYIADRDTLSAGIDRKNYQLQLLHMTTRGQSLRLTTPLNYSPIKMRITMMNTTSSRRTGLLSYALLFPVFFLSALVASPLAPSIVEPISDGFISTETPAETELTPIRGLQKEDILFVIRPSIERKVLLKIKETLAERGVTVAYEKLDYENNRLKNISVSISSEDYSYNLSYNPITGPLVFYDFQRSGGATGFEYGVPDHFDLNQQLDLKNTTGLLIRLSGDRVIVRGSATI
ncbi:MAG: M56 family metallopeptidase [Bacteroidota bacterium]